MFVSSDCRAGSHRATNVFQASNANAALDIVRRENIDLILLDLIIPGPDGLEIMREVRRLSPDMNIIMMSAYFGGQV
ncbi:response regulator [Paenibacillus hamazuiensis]|uniref:response regulator n=1 Tax=Paenibacillus hamazuiensis TaxID=2936508 RepID=UPI00200E20E6